MEGEERQGKRLAELARKAGVSHFVYTSVGSAHRRTGIPHFENKARIEQAVRGLGFPSCTILRPVFFMENWTSPSFNPSLAEGKLAIGIRADTPLEMIAVESSTSGRRAWPTGPRRRRGDDGEAGSQAALGDGQRPARREPSQSALQVLDWNLGRLSSVLEVGRNVRSIRWRRPGPSWEGPPCHC